MHTTIGDQPQDGGARTLDALADFDDPEFDADAAELADLIGDPPPLRSNRKPSETSDCEIERDHAIALTQRFRVFPLVPNTKNPAITGWPDRASNDPKIVADMWTCPVSGDALNYNIGISCDNLLIVDVDIKDGKPGEESLRQLVEKHGLDTNTLTSLTPSGGRHLYYRLPPGVHVSNSTGKLGPGLDVRGYHGYIAAPGSTINGRKYRWVDPAAPTLLAPPWFIAKCGEAAPHSANHDRTLVIDLDTPDAIRRAVDWLKTGAPEAVEGVGGDQTTYQVAAMVKDFGISEPMCLELMLKYWNETKALPNWDPDDLERKVVNAYRYGKNPPGSASAQAEFDEVEMNNEPGRERGGGASAHSGASAGASAQSDEPNAEPWPTPTPLRERDPATIPARRWIVPGLLVRRSVTGLISAGGVGKTQLVASICLAVASGNRKPLGMEVKEPTSVWYWNQEDDIDELDRRFAAARKHYGIPWSELKDAEGRRRLYVNSGVERPLTLAGRLQNGDLGANKQTAQVVDEIKAANVGLFIIDPLSEFHEAGENDNVEMRLVWGLARRIAVQADCAVLVAAHSRKPPQAASDGSAGDMDSLRGASSQTGVMRLAFTMYGMSGKDAKAWGVPEDERHRFVRLDGAKSNLSLMDGKPFWFRRVSVPLTESGETVGVLEPAELIERAGVDPLHIVAKTLFGDDDPSRWHALTELLGAMTESEQAIFGATNRARVINKALDDHGCEFDAGTGAGATLTDFGMLEILNRKGNKGFSFRLSGGPTSEQQAAAHHRGNL